jgi:hypothetical protein
MACPYKYALGIPGMGFHATRIGPFALYDILGTIAIAAITWWLRPAIPLWKHLVGWFILGEALHLAFGTDTAFLRVMGLERNCPA